MILPQTKQSLGYLKMKQIEAFQDEKKRLYIAREFIRAKTGLSPVGDTISELLGFEGKEANKYFDSIGVIRERPANDPKNALFNYAFSVLEAYCRYSINAHGLEPSIGFLHSLTRKSIIKQIKEPKESLVYDFQEIFRSAFSEAVLATKVKSGEFYRTEDYHVRLRAEASKRLLAEIQTSFRFTDLHKCVFALTQFLKGRSDGLRFPIAEVRPSHPLILQ